jgi:hypothetical protein
VIFSIYYVAALVLVASELWGSRTAWRLSLPALPAPVWVVTIVVSYAAQIACAASIAMRGPWPLPVVVSNGSRADPVTFVLLALGTLQCFALLALYRARPAAAWWMGGGAVMLAFSVLAPVLTSADLYAYVGNGLLGGAAYVPPRIAFSGEFALINHWWHVPVPAATYGPLWLTIARLVGMLPGALFAKLLAFRALGALVFCAAIALLRSAGAPARAVAIAALDPGLHFQFVLNAHNDLLPVALVIAGAALVRRFPATACGLIVVAALVKLPYALCGLPILAAIRSQGGRYVAAACTLVASIAISWFAGGTAYLRALMTYASGSHLVGILHVIAALGAVIAVLATLFFRRRPRTAVWLIPMLGAYTASWYAAWSVPYALSRHRILAYLLVAFPFVSILAEPSLARPWTMLLVIPLLAALAVLRALPLRAR